MEVAPGVHRLTLGAVNFYLVEERGRLALVDAGAPRDWALLLRTVASVGRALSDMDAVVITHAHADHTGFAERARTDAGAVVRVHEADVPVARGARPPRNERGVARYLLRAEAYRTLFSLLWRGATRIIPCGEVASFADGETLDVPGRPRVIHAPGHTPGSSALHIADRGVLFTGDALVTRNPLTGRVGPQVMPSALNRDSRQAMESLARLESVAARVVLPGHGEPWTEGVRDAVRLARETGFS